MKKILNKNDGLTQKVVFLDVDGPLINTPMFYLDPQCSIKRTTVNTQAVAYVKRLCKLTGAKVVMNTTHNAHVMDGRSVKDDLVRWGMPEDYFHMNWRTDYPSYRRGLCVENWLKANGADWVAFDDDKFTDDPRLVLIDFDLGVDKAAFNKALKHFGYRGDAVILSLYGDLHSVRNVI
jgi:hypothetical protein